MVGCGISLPRAVYESVQSGAGCVRPAVQRVSATGGSVGVQSCRHRQPRRGRDAADPCRPGALRGDRDADRDRRALHRRGPHRHLRPGGRPGLRLGPASARPYLDLAVLERALRRDAAPTRPGSAGASSPRTRRSPSCATELGVTFVGPTAEAMRKLGDKIGAKLIAEEVGVPVAPWSRGAVDDPGRRRSRAADEIGYPLMLKATAGGGGRGIRVITSAERARRGLRAHRAGGRCARSAAASCSWSAWSPARGTSRCR